MLKQIGPWELEVDVEATRELYAAIPDGAEDCTCDHCQNWAVERDRTITPPIRDFLADLGIDWRREAEVWEADPRRASHLCAGWFHLVGRILRSPPQAPRERRIGLQSNPVSIADGYEVLFHDGLPPMKPATQAARERGVPLFTLEFRTTRHALAGGEEPTES